MTKEEFAEKWGSTQGCDGNSHSEADYLLADLNVLIDKLMPTDSITDLEEIEKIILFNYSHFKDSVTVSWSLTAANAIIMWFRSRIKRESK